MVEPESSCPPSGYIGRPRHRLFMVFDDSAAAARGLKALGDLGYAGDQVWVLHGEEGEHCLDLTGRFEGMWTRLARTVEQVMSADIGYLHSVKQALEAGGTVVAVGVLDAATAERVATVLHESAAWDFAYFANWEFQPVRVPVR